MLIYIHPCVPDKEYQLQRQLYKIALLKIKTVFPHKTLFTKKLTVSLRSRIKIKLLREQKALPFFKTHICKYMVLTFATKYFQPKEIAILTLKRFQKKTVSQKQNYT